MVDYYYMPTDDEVKLFQSMMQKVTPLKKSERHALFEKKQTFLLNFKKNFNTDPYQELYSHYFEGHPKDHWVDGDTPLHFARNGISTQQLRKLQRNPSIISRWLDLHRLTIKEALLTTHRFIEQCNEENIRHMGLIHGKGYRTNKQFPILKNVLNDWLPTHPAVLAFLSAKIKDGGTGAMYVLLKNLK